MATAALGAAGTAIFAVAAASVLVAVAVAAVDAVTAAVAAVAVLVCAVDAAVADELAAIAAAAIASGAVALPDPGVAAAGVAVVGTMTGTATAITLAVAACDPPCWAGAAGAVEESVADVLSEDDFVVDFVVSDFESPDFVRGCCAASALALALVAALALAFAFALAFASALASELCRALASRSSKAFLAARSSSAVLLDRAASALAAASSARRCDPDGGGAFEVALLVSGGMLSSTSAPKLSLCCDGSGCCDFGSAVWNNALAARSDVTLYTGDLSGMN